MTSSYCAVEIQWIALLHSSTNTDTSRFEIRSMNDPRMGCHVATRDRWPWADWLPSSFMKNNDPNEAAIFIALFITDRLQCETHTIGVTIETIGNGEKHTLKTECMYVTRRELQTYRFRLVTSARLWFKQRTSSGFRLSWFELRISYSISLTQVMGRSLQPNQSCANRLTHAIHTRALSSVRDIKSAPPKGITTPIVLHT